MAIVLRFVDVEGIIRERFLDLVHVTDTFSLTLKSNLWRQLLRLQLALVAASKEIIPINQFFNNLVSIINVVCSSSKRHDELQKAKGVEIKELLELGEIKSGKGENQATTLKRAGDTRWGSHYHFVCNLLNMFHSTRVVLKGIINDTSASSSHRSDADAVYSHTKSFEFVFILHLVKEVMGITDILSQALQKKSQDILNAMELVSATKENLNAYRNNGWDSLITKVKCFYLFTSTLDKQLHELNSRFNDQAIELLSLSFTLVSKKQHKAINIDDICLLVENYYPVDFTEQERIQLRYQLELFNIEMIKNPNLSDVSTLADLCQSLVKTQKRETYYLLDRVVQLILTLPVSTTTTERRFSAMKMVKNRLRNRMSDEFLANNLVVFIERKLLKSLIRNQ
ncbi:uncharacterized protein LOC143536955 [Bidens hawaiensis]|uniref:uncharacterized protein LOC143536955 n=1 Tax=Bidens hawaiensis TaxID=980011 RepID=UPI00404ACC7E